MGNSMRDISESMIVAKQQNESHAQLVVRTAGYQLVINRREVDMARGNSCV